jgi:hypothetical protein
VLNSVPDVIQPGNYSLRFLSKSKEILYDVSFCAQYYMNIDPSPGYLTNKSYGSIEIDFAPFCFATIYPQGTHIIELVHIENTSKPLVSIKAKDINEFFHADGGGPYVVDADEEATLDASDSHSMYGDITNYSWDLNNDSVFDDAYGVVVSSSFSVGNHTVCLKISDDYGHEDFDQAIVIVNESPHEHIEIDSRLNALEETVADLNENIMDIKNDISNLNNSLSSLLAVIIVTGLLSIISILIVLRIRARYWKTKP